MQLLLVVGGQVGLVVALAVLVRRDREEVDRKVLLAEVAGQVAQRAWDQMVVFLIPVDRVALVRMVLDFLAEQNRMVQEVEDFQSRLHHHKRDSVGQVVEEVLLSSFASYES